MLPKAPDASCRPSIARRRASSTYGLSLGATSAGIVGALIVFIFTRGDWALGIVLGLAMVINMFVAATAGTLIPLGLRAANIDPALASSVFITTLTDVFGFFAYLGLATLFVSYLVGV